MRVFELVIFFGILIFSFLFYFKKEVIQSRFLRIFLYILIFFSIIHLVFEGFRWQIVPLYLIVICLTVISFFPPKNNIISLLSKTLILLFLLVNVVSVSLLPLPKLPKPTGDYGVGTQEFYLVDENRKEIYGSGINEPREIMIQAWYPIEKDYKGKPSPWMPKMPYFTDEIGERFGIPGFMLEHLIYVKSNSIFGAEITLKETSFPVILFSHGWAGFKEQNVFQVEELASHGYTVVAVNHTYGAMMSVFPDGRSYPRNREALPEGVSDQEYYIASNKLVKQWAEDLEFVLKELNILNEQVTSQFFEKLQLEQVGVMGHSTGGGASVEFCFENPTCGAFLGMDPWLEPVTREKLVDGQYAPMLLMFSEAWSKVPENEGNQPSVNVLLDETTAWSSEMVISETMHFDFSITPVISPLTELLGFKGSLDGDRILEIINAYSLDFFGEFIGEKESKLIDGNNSNYPEVLYIVNNSANSVE